MKIFLAGENQKKHIIPSVHKENYEVISGVNREQALALRERERDDLKVYLAGVAPWKEQGLYDKAITAHRPYILESFYYVNNDTKRLLPYFGDFLLDSGAFTFMQGKTGSPNWDEYIERYANFIKENKVQKYFELDIDSVVGYERVKEYRRKLESLVGWKCIPVWHKSRGITEYYRHCTEYPYVGIGGYVIKELTPEEYKAFPQMIRYAHKNGAKVHCLGFTRLCDLPKYHFDSVDSTAWTTGNRFGFIYKFNGETMVKYNAPKGMRLADSKKVALNNYIEWLKFQQYAERCL